MSGEIREMANRECEAVVALETAERKQEADACWTDSLGAPPAKAHRRPPLHSRHASCPLKMPEETRSRLLDLPAELRIRIYEYCLAPTGTLCLTATKSKRYATTPRLAPSLLQTCRQIYTEAQDLIHEQNRVCFSIDAHDTSWPVISEKRLPQYVLERLEHAAIVLDTATTFYSSYHNIDWTALTALVSLKTLQLSIIWQREASSTTPASWMDFYDLLEEVIERIPRNTAITYGTEEGTPERELLGTVVERRQRGRTGAGWGQHGAGPVSVQELTAAEYAELEEMVGSFDQGARSGGIEDVYAEYHEDRMKMFSKARVEPLRTRAVEMQAF